jgi:hypothetical protein
MDGKRTALHIAAEWGHADAVKLLLAAGAAPHLSWKDRNGYTPIDNARNSGTTLLPEYLQFIADDPAKCPTPADVGLDMHQRNAALKALGRPALAAADIRQLHSRPGQRS